MNRAKSLSGETNNYLMKMKRKFAECADMISFNNSNKKHSHMPNRTSRHLNVRRVHNAICFLSEPNIFMQQFNLNVVSLFKIKMILITVPK